MEDFLTGVYKDVGKEPKFIKISNSLEILKQLIGGDIETIKYQNFIIIYNKNNKNLIPNIWIDTGFLKLGTTIRGKVFIVRIDKDGKFESLTKEQCLKCRDILVNKSFNYENSNQKKYNIVKYDKNNFQRSLQMERVDSKTNSEKFNQEETLKMILGIQAMILKYIKNNN